MATHPKAFRLPQETIQKLSTLADLLKESETKVIARAIDMLYEKRKEVVEEDARARISKANEE